MSVDPITLLPTPHRRRFTKRAPITITNGGAAALTNYQVKVTVTYDADMQADFSDLRFSNASGRHRYRYWIESKTDSTTATVWVRVPSIPTGNSTIYMYYGRSGLPAGSNGHATFPFFCDAWTSMRETNRLERPSKITIPTPDGSGESLHPSVVYIAGGWGTENKPYWMVMTPYKDADSSLENPSILCSADGITWTVPAGVTNPLVAPPANGFQSDPELVHNPATNELWIYWRRTDNTPEPDETTTHLMKSTDGVNWYLDGTLISEMSEAEITGASMLGPWPTGGTIERCPCVVRRSATEWHYWAQRDADIVHRTSTDGETWSDAAACTPDVTKFTGKSSSVWHMSVWYSESLSKYLMVGMVKSYFHLFLAESADGDTWTWLTWQLLGINPDSTEWDATWYRPAAVEIDGQVTLYLSTYRTSGAVDAWIGRCAPISAAELYRVASGECVPIAEDIATFRRHSWVDGGSVAASGGVLTLTPLFSGPNTSIALARAGHATFTSNVALRASINPDTQYYCGLGLGETRVAPTNGTSVHLSGIGNGYQVITSGATWKIRKTADQVGSELASTTVTFAGAYHTWELCYGADGRLRAYLDDVQKGALTGQNDHLTANKFPYVVQCIYDATAARVALVDWMLVRNWTATEPTTAVGAEASGTWKVAA
jgi:hypothetical protein